MYTTNSHELSGQDALDYILSGKGKGTLIGKAARYTFKFNQPVDRDKVIFVSFLAGTDNETDYQYIGYISLANREFLPGKKGNPNHPAYRAFDWYLRALSAQSEKSLQATFLHEGVCGRCGRTLTNPESIVRGIGPECAKHRP